VGSRLARSTGRAAVVSVARLRFVSLVLALAALAAPSTVAAVPIGIVSYDTFIPGPDGVNAFGITNISGDFNLPPDFPVTTALQFLGSTLTLTREDGGTDVFALGDIGPGVFEDPRLFFSDLQLFVSATFAATLSTQTLALADGTTLFAPSAAFAFTLLPSVGGALTPGDFAIIDIVAAPPDQSVPEPGSLALLGVGLTGYWIASRRRR
jgi:hypothetical protein